MAINRCWLRAIYLEAALPSCRVCQYRVILILYNHHHVGLKSSRGLAVRAAARELVVCAPAEEAFLQYRIVALNLSKSVVNIGQSCLGNGRIGGGRSRERYGRRWHFAQAWREAVDAEALLRCRWRRRRSAYGRYGSILLYAAWKACHKSSQLFGGKEIADMKYEPNCACHLSGGDGLVLAGKTEGCLLRPVFGNFIRRLLANNCLFYYVIKARRLITYVYHRNIWRAPNGRSNQCRCSLLPRLHGGIHRQRRRDGEKLKLAHGGASDEARRVPCPPARASSF